jgi:hypothetical protein
LIRAQFNTSAEKKRALGARLPRKNPNRAAYSSSSNDKSGSNPAKAIGLSAEIKKKQTTQPNGFFAQGARRTVRWQESGSTRFTFLNPGGLSPDRTIQTASRENARKIPFPGSLRAA